MAYFIVWTVIILLRTIAQLPIVDGAATDLFGKNWIPKSKHEPNVNPFVWFWRGTIQEAQIPKTESGHRFEWFSIAGYTQTQDSKKSVLLLGGTSNKEPPPGSRVYPFAKTRSTVVNCTFSQDSTKPFFIGEVVCQRSPNPFKFPPKFLGNAISALNDASGKYQYIVCDDMWVNETVLTSSSYTRGLCYSKHDTGEKVIPCKIDGCTLGKSVYPIKPKEEVPYFAIKARKTVPYSTNEGSIETLYSYCDTLAVDSYGKSGFCLFNKLTLLGKNYRKVEQRNMLADYVISLGEDFYLIAPNTDKFAYFGYALDVLDHEYAVIGTPFSSVGDKKNVGRVHLWCPKKPATISNVTGNGSNEYFGFSVVNVGDVDGDGREDFAVGAPSFRSPENSRVYIFRVQANCTIDPKPIQILKFKDVGSVGVALSSKVDMDFNGRPDLLVASFNHDKPVVVGQRPLHRALCKYIITPTNLHKRPLGEKEMIQIKFEVRFIDVFTNASVSLTTLSVIDQFSPDLYSPDNAPRFQLVGSLSTTKTADTIKGEVQIKGTKHIEDMDFSSPFVVGYRHTYDCEMEDCQNLVLPLFDWSQCTSKINIVQFHCPPYDECNSDLQLLEVTDLSDVQDIFYGVSKTSQRVVRVGFINKGPTQAKRVKLLITTTGSMRIGTINPKELNESIFTTDVSAERTQATISVSSRTVPMDVEYWLNVDVYFDGLGDRNSDYKNSSVIFNLKAGSKDSNETNNIVVKPYRVVYMPEIQLGQSFEPNTLVDNRTKEPFVGEEHNIQVDILGPRLNHSFVIENAGNATVNNLSMTLRIPVSTDGFYIIYIFDQIRWRMPNNTVIWLPVLPQLTLDGLPVGKCEVPTQFINPMRLNPMETHEEHQDNVGGNLMRVRRAAEPDTSPAVETPDDGSKFTRPLTEKDLDKPTLRRNPQEVIRCGKTGVTLSKPICANIRCTVPTLKAGALLKLEFIGWLFAKTFFKKTISDVEIFTQLQTNIGEVPEGVQVLVDKSQFGPKFISQTFLFSGIKKKIVHQLPIWPIILGIILGVLLLVVIIVALYKCGFFKRKYRTKEKKPRGPSILHPADLQPERVDQDDQSLLYTPDSPPKAASS